MKCQFYTGNQGKISDKECNDIASMTEYGLILCDEHYVLLSIDPEDWPPEKEENDTN